jgi:uncharacterized membrane protein YagU involved in acid resistance
MDTTAIDTTGIQPSAHGLRGARVIFWAGLVAGTLDLTAACVLAWLVTGVTPVRILQTVASGLLGQDAFIGGVKTAMLGLVLHFIIATIWAAVYYLASRRLSFLIDQTIIAGVLYGVLVWLFMNFVVLPLSAVTKSPVPLSARIIGMLIVTFGIGLPIAFIIRRFSKE